MNIQHLVKLTPIIFLILSCTASQPETPKTNESEFAWMAGTWVGEGFGGTMEETWSLPSPEGTLIENDCDHILSGHYIKLFWTENPFFEISRTQDLCERPGKS